MKDCGSEIFHKFLILNKVVFVSWTDVHEGNGRYEL